MKNKLIVVALLIWLGLLHFHLTASAQPVVTTLAASGVTATNGTLNGTVNPNGAATTAYFQYGLTTNYGSFSATNSLAAGNTTLSVSNLISGLVPNTTYHFRMVGANSFGPDLGADLTFTTAPAPPTATTLAASGLTATNALLNGTLLTGGLNTTAYFRYGLTTSYGSFSVTNSLAATNTALSVSDLIGGLLPNTTYHFQLVANNSAGTGQGGDVVFTTLPSVTTSPATSITATSATLNGSLKPGNGVTTAYFQYGLTTNYDRFSATNSVSSTNATLSVSNLINSLAPGTTYHFQLMGMNSVGTALGGDLTVTTSAGGPRVTTLAASGVTGTNATLNGALTTGGLNTTAYFRYGLTTNYGSFSATNSLGASNTALAVSNLISSLIQASTYHFQLVASNSAGTALSADLTFTTAALPPVVTTLPATSITLTNATLHGTVNPNGGVTTAYFQYGLTTNYGYLGGHTVLPATNATLTLPGLVLDSLPAAAGANWTQSSAPVGTWNSIASSADGTRLAAGLTSGGIYVSTNSGGTWTQSDAPARVWAAITSSADGAQLAAADYSPPGSGNGSIWTSTNSGVTWTRSSAPTNGWRAITSSADGTQLAAVSYDHLIWTSKNRGETWTQSGDTNLGWNAIASSADGSRLTAAVLGGGIYTSTNSGIAWTQTSVSNADWHTMASSADGTVLAAATYDIGGSLLSTRGIWISTDGGVTWTRTSALNASWISMAPSADGSRLAAADNGRGIYTSTNSGLTWAMTGAPAATWESIASSADGTQLAAVVYNGGIWTSTGAASGLTPGTVYHYRVVGINSASTRLGIDLTFTTSPIAPLVSTLAASGISATTATLNGAVNPFGAATTAYFRYGLTTNYGSFSATNSLPATNATLLVSNLISSLSPGTTYHYQLVGSNSVGTSLGADRTFTTTLPGPTVATLAASGVTAINGILNGTVNPNGDTTTAYFQYGLTTNYGSFSATNSLAATNTTLAVSNLIGGLASGTVYHFRIVGMNGGGITLGVDLTFTTGFPAPAVATLAASGVTATNATLSGTVNPNGAATMAYFQYGLTTNYGTFSATNSRPATNTTLAVSNLIGSLASGTVYHFRIVGVNSGGTTLGVDLTFTTGFPAPAVATLAASGVTATNATLNGTVNPNGAAATAYFQYGLTTSYGSYTATNTLPATNMTLAVSNLIGSLAPGAVFHFRIVGVNTGGTTLGVDRTFTNSLVAPTVTTLAASGVTATNAILQGTVNPNGDTTTAYFQYGLTTNYGSFSATNSLAATNTTLAVSNLISGLVPGTVSHFRIVGVNSRGTTFGVDLTFTTGFPAPAVATLAASGVTATNATLNGTVNPDGAATTAYFQYGLTTSYGSYTATNTLPATNTTLAVSNLIGSLVPGRTYHFRMAGVNSGGTALGADRTLTTILPLAVNFNLIGSIVPPVGALQLRFTNLSGLSFTVLSGTNLGLPLSNWTVLGAPTETPPGQYQFTDQNPMNVGNPFRFYRVRSP